MTTSSLFFLSLFIVLLTLSPSRARAESPVSGDAEFLCSPDSPPSCKTYLTYRARAPYIGLRNISTLFGVSPSTIAEASNLPSEDSPLVKDQLLLIPITCTSNGTRFFSNFTYQINEGDSFYVVSITAFENLTNYHIVEEMNPNLMPNNLMVGQKAVFPLLCKCPAKPDLRKGIKYLLTYVWQPGDDVLPVSTTFNTSASDIITENNYRNFTAAVCLPVLIPVSQIPVLSQPYPSLPQRNKSSKHQSTMISALSISGSILFFLLASLLVYIRFSCKKKKAMIRYDSALENADLIQAKKGSKEETFEPKVIQDKLLPGVSRYLDKPIMYDRKVIMEGTMNLSERCRIGGSVYRAMIDGQIFAVKKTRDAAEELKILQKVNHANLVKLKAISSDNEGNHFLVYEYAENGSLDKWLYPNKSSAFLGSAGFLSWAQRLNIALDVASGLQYMHDHTQPSIVHRDIRTSNILLDSKFKAKISNFLLAKSATSSVMSKIDVFAFGVVLLELLSGRKAMETKHDGEIGMLWKELRGILEDEETREERLRKWMDPNLESFYPMDGAMSLAALARACTSEYSARPGMTEIVFNLSVLAHSSTEIYEGSPVSTAEAEEVHITNQVTAR
ncbi:Non-specific serine/threonine protein kinase [Bertholletia excelsa]